MATTWYVDNAASGANNGTSWLNAWTDPNSVSGASAGDTVYISGGSVTKTYTLSGAFNQWSVKNGSAGNKITYQIGQDAGHTGIAIFTPGGSTNQFIFGCDYITLSGKLGTGSDGVSHIRFFANSLAADGIDSDNIHDVLIEYVDFGIIKQMFGSNPVLGFLEISHCQVIITGATAGRASYCAFTRTATGYDQNGLIHDCDIAIPYDNVANDGFGADGLQWVGSGFTIRDNYIHGVGEAGARGDHQDGWQGSGVQWVKIYNNRFEEIQNYCIFAELPSASAVNTNLLIYNNTCLHHNGTGSQAIAVGGDSAQSKICTNVQVWNNIADGYTFPFTIRNPGSGSDPSAFINCAAKNNIDIETAGSGNIFDPAVSVAANIAVSAANAPNYFVFWTSSPSLIIDYHLKAAATPLIGTGEDGSAVIGSLDKSGQVRTAPWDVGVYRYLGQVAGVVYKRLGRYLRLFGPSA